MDLKISIAGVCIGFFSPFAIQIPEQFFPFLSQSLQTDIKVHLIEKENLPEFSADPVYSAEIYSVYEEQKSVTWRCFSTKDKKDTYYAACKIDENQSESLILYNKEGIARLNHLGSTMYHIGWEKHLLNFKRFIFHASCIDTAFGGILFSGVSGIGKSTQADLWCRYEAATLINGDRPIIGKSNGCWNAYGSPYAGSSKCYVNASVPIKAIVLLGQGSSCRIRKLKGRAAFHKVLEQTTVNQWDSESMNKTCDLVLELIAAVPVYEMVCTPDRDAVECLKEVLQEGMQSAEE